MNDVGAVIDFVRIVGTQLSVVQIEYLIGENAEAWTTADEAAPSLEERVSVLETLFMGGEL